MEKVIFNQVVKVGCGIDVHKDNIVATIRRSEEDYETKEFSSFTGSLTELRDWCTTEGVTHIAMESTGVYWKPVYNILEEGGFETIPDGKYQAEIEDASLKININGDHMISYEMKILNSEHAGRKVWRHGTIKSKDNLRFLKKDLLLCGLILDKFSELPNHIHKLRGLRLEITKKTSGKFSNIFFNKRLVSPPQPTGDVPY